MQGLTAEQAQEIAKCADGFKGLMYWISRYCWTWDKVHKRKARYPLWPYQKNLLEELWKGGLILVEKSRDLMVTWTVCEFCLWNLQFNPYWTGFATSRRENEVDNGGEKSTPVSIFGRIRFSWNEQPAWLQVNLGFSHLKVRNLEEGLYMEMTGESANPDVGRSSDVYFKWGDEFALVDQSELAHAAMIGGGFNTLLYTSTSNLTGNEFYRLRSSEGSGFRVLTYSWRHRPDRSEDWYEKKKATMTEEQRAKELDIKYEVSGPLRVWGQFDPRIHVVTQESLPLSGGYALLAFDEGYSHPGALYYVRVVDRKMFVVREVYKSKIHTILPTNLRGPENKDWVWIMEELIEDLGPVKAIVVGNESRGFEDTLVARGHYVYRVGKDKLERIRQVAMLMQPGQDGKPSLVIGEECVNLQREIPKYKWKTKGGVQIDLPAPGVDHGCDALQCAAEFANSLDAAAPWTSSFKQAGGKQRVNAGKGAGWMSSFPGVNDGRHR